MASTNNFYGTSTTKRQPPKPPPRVAGTAASRRPNANKTAARKPAYQSSRAVASSSKPLSGNGPKAMPSSRNKASSSTTARSSGTALRARKAPVASRPVGSYYNSGAATTSTESTSSSFGAANPYASSMPAAAASTTGTTAAATTTDTTDDDNWDDWAAPSPTKTTTNTASNTTAAANPHSSWAAPSNTPAASSTNDWYSSSASASSNPSAAPSGYTSSGFINPPTQQQQQNPMQAGSGFYQSNTSQQQQQEQQPFLSGAMDSAAPSMSAMNPNTTASMTTTDPNAAQSGMPSFSMFMPSAVNQQQQPQGATDSYPSIEDEAPLLEELGINIQHMMLKSKAVVFPFSRFGGDQIDPAAICQDADPLGPIALLLLLGGEMVLTGKLQFGYIYIYGLFGCIAMTLVVNLISPKDAVSFWTVTSIMGYALLPVNILALIKIFVVNLIKLQTLGNILGGLTILWSTMASTRLLELGCGLRDQRYLIMYPLLLFYSAFVMMTIL